MPKTNDFLRPFFLDFWRVLSSPDFGVGPLFGSKNRIFSLFFDVAIFYRFSSVLGRFREGLGRIWGGLGRVWGRFGEGLGRAWEAWGGFGEGFGLIFGSKMTFGGQSGAGMFKMCLGTFD